MSLKSKIMRASFNAPLVETFLEIHSCYPERDSELHGLLNQFLYKIKVEELNFKAHPGEGAEIINLFERRKKPCR